MWWWSFQGRQEAGGGEGEEEVRVRGPVTGHNKRQKNKHGGFDSHSTMPGTSDSLTPGRIVLNTCESIFSSFLRGTASTFRWKFSRLIPGATVSHTAIKLSPLLQRIQTHLFREDACRSPRLPVRSSSLADEDNLVVRTESRHLERSHPRRLSTQGAMLLSMYVQMEKGNAFS